MKPANPVSYFVDGNNTKELVYLRPGSCPYFVMVRKPGIVVMSLVVFADSMDDVDDRLRQIAEFRLQCELERQQNYSSVHPDSVSRLEFGVRMAGEILDLLAGKESELEMQVEQVSRDRPLKVAWGVNDTVL